MNDEIILYRTDDGKNEVNLLSRDGMVWLNQSQMAELFDTSKQNISYHISNILQDREFDAKGTVKDYLTMGVNRSGIYCEILFSRHGIGCWIPSSLCPWGSVPPMGQYTSVCLSAQRIRH